jgi:hypothetical protein
MPTRPIDTGRALRRTALTGLVSLAAFPLAAMAQPALANTEAAPSVGLCKALAVHRINARVQTIASLEQSNGFAASLARASGKPAAAESDAVAKTREELAAATQLLLALGTEQGAMPTELTGEVLRGGTFDTCARAHAGRARRLDAPGRWVVLTAPDSITQIAVDEASFVRSGNRASYVSVIRLQDGEPTSQGPTRFLLGVFQVSCDAERTERPMTTVYLKPGTTASWKAIDVSIGNRGFSAIAKGSAADVMAQLACGPAAFKPDAVREPSLGVLVQRWND